MPAAIFVPIGAAPILRSLYDIAVARAHPARCLPRHLPAPAPAERIVVIGAGKAAAAMAIATEQHYADLPAERFSGFVVTRHGFELPTRRIEVVGAAHPIPDRASQSAASRALMMAAAADERTLLLVLLSGGASALWSAPVDGISFEAKQGLTRDLLRSGATIGEINTIRRHISRIKGGKLAAQSRAGRLLTLAISDVPGDRPEAIGSGPTVADTTTLADARNVLRRYGLSPDPAIDAALRDPNNETLKPGDARLAGAEFRLVATPRASLEAAAEKLTGLGYAVEMLGDALEGEAREVAAEHAARALAAQQQRRKLAILSGGELTVTIKGDGRGGPNQEYALALAIALAGAPGISALAADTDGIDGGGGAATDPAGAMVLPDTLARAAAQNLSPAKLLDNNDSTGFFGAIGDLVECGPTQTNVNDFRVILVDP
jgi:hydroxypyruvate reductase